MNLIFRIEKISNEKINVTYHTSLCMVETAIFDIKENWDESLIKEINRGIDEYYIDLKSGEISQKNKEN